MGIHFPIMGSWVFHHFIKYGELSIMTDRTWKKLQFMLLKMAEEDPNQFIGQVYYSGMDSEDINELKYIINVARRATGYETEKDLLLINGIC
jgi:RimJ/RimL family protein N-acetyltransferase